MQRIRNEATVYGGRKADQLDWRTVTGDAGVLRVREELMRGL